MSDQTYEQPLHKTCPKCWAALEFGERVEVKNRNGKVALDGWSMKCSDPECDYQARGARPPYSSRAVVEAMIAQKVTVDHAKAVRDE